MQIEARKQTNSKIKKKINKSNWEDDFMSKRYKNTKSAIIVFQVHIMLISFTFERKIKGKSNIFQRKRGKGKADRDGYQNYVGKHLCHQCRFRIR